MSASEMSCGNCAADHGPDDIFCENCGYDFITGSLPGAGETASPLAAPPGVAPKPAVPDGFTPPAPDESVAASPDVAPTPPAATVAEPPAPPTPPSSPPEVPVPPTPIPLPEAEAPTPFVPGLSPSPNVEASSGSGSMAASGVDVAADGGAAPAPEPASAPQEPDAASTASPEETLGPDSAAIGSSRPAGILTLGSAIEFSIEVVADSDYFEAVVSEGELEFPQPTPEKVRLTLMSNELHIGRTSESRAIHPDIDVADLTGDPAVSSRHAVIRVGVNDEVTVTDIGSTNGTFVGSFESPPISAGDPLEIGSRAELYVGAWTKLLISQVGADEAASTSPPAS